MTELDCTHYLPRPRQSSGKTKLFSLPLCDGLVVSDYVLKKKRDRVEWLLNPTT